MSRLVLLSGWGIDARIWHGLDSHWPDDITVTTPDWPGYGRHGALTDPTDVASLAQAMHEVLPSDAVWVGWSLGGLLAAAMLRFLPSPRALVMLGMTPRFTATGTRGVTGRELALFQAAFARDPQRTWAHFVRWQVNGEPSPNAAQQRLEKMIGKAMPADIPTLKAGLEQLASWDLHHTLSHAPCPVVYLRGEDDPLLPPPEGYSPQVLAGSGHCPQVSIPEQLTQRLTAIVRCARHNSRKRARHV
jgi:pimeloyl-[acyl-carrier protein] methyl ester esterase